MNLKQVKAIEKANKARWLKKFPNIPDTSGIYMLTREDDGFRYAYIGQARRILSRLAQHLAGYQHIDLSLKKHGLYDADNPTGWRVAWDCCAVDDLDEQEQSYIRAFATTHQLYNHTTGGQCDGKRGLGAPKQPKGYYDGKKQGRTEVLRELGRLFRYVNISPKSGKLAARMYEKLLGVINESEQ